MNGILHDPIGLLSTYCVLVFAASLAGGWLMLTVNLTHTRLQLAISFVAGLMLGISILHFLPDAADQLGSLKRATEWVLGGFVAMFFLQRFFHFHHHDLPKGDPEDCCHDHSQPQTEKRHLHDHHPDADHEHHHNHDHEHPSPEGHAHTLAEKSAKQLSWAGTAMGLTFHSLLDGLAMAAAVEVGVKGHAALAGLGVALAVFLHKPFDAMAVTTLMTVGGKSKISRQMLNALFALATPFGVLLYFLGASTFAESNAVFLGCSLAFCSGTFLCIAGSDLLPELQFHSHDRLKLSIALMVGLGVAILIGNLESDHAEPAIPKGKISRLTTPYEFPSHT